MDLELLIRTSGFAIVFAAMGLWQVAGDRDRDRARVRHPGGRDAVVRGDAQRDLALQPRQRDDGGPNRSTNALPMADASYEAPGLRILGSGGSRRGTELWTCRRSRPSRAITMKRT